MKYRDLGLEAKQRAMVTDLRAGAIDGLFRHLSTPPGASEWRMSKSISMSERQFVRTRTPQGMR